MHLDIPSAYERVRKYVRKTPVISTSIGTARVLLKLENLQYTGSFKVRGAFNKIIRHKSRVKGVVAASAGNHAQAVARAARTLGIEKVKIVVPRNAPEIKKRNIKLLGAELIVEGSHLNESLKVANEIALSGRMTFIHPYDDLEIIEGQGTLGIELMDYDFDYLLIPVGGGGLASGVCTALRQSSSHSSVKVIGVVARNAPSFFYSFKQGRMVAVEPKDTIADGIRLKSPSDMTFSILSRCMDDVVMVDEAVIRSAISWAYYHLGQVVEGAGAVGIAALMQGKVTTNGKVMVMVTGGNIDERTLDAILDGSPI